MPFPLSFVCLVPMNLQESELKSNEMNDDLKQISELLPKKPPARPVVVTRVRKTRKQAEEQPSSAQPSKKRPCQRVPSSVAREAVRAGALLWATHSAIPTEGVSFTLPLPNIG